MIPHQLSSKYWPRLPFPNALSMPKLIIITKRKHHPGIWEEVIMSLNLSVSTKAILCQGSWYIFFINFMQIIQCLVCIHTNTHTPGYCYFWWDNTLVFPRLAKRKHYHDLHQIAEPCYLRHQTSPSCRRGHMQQQTLHPLHWWVICGCHQSCTTCSHPGAACYRIM